MQIRLKPFDAPRDDVFLVVNRGPAIWATVVALALTNIGVAATIVALMGSGMPLWIGLAVTAVGVVGLMIAVRLWRRYLEVVRTRAPMPNA